MSFPAYVDYKDSEVEWVGQVPLHWEVDRFKRSTVSCRNGIWGKEAQRDENDIPCVRVADFDRESLTTVAEIPTVRNVTESERSERTLSKGNLLLEKSGGGDLQPVGFVVLYDRDEPAVCSNFVAKVELAEDMDPSFWRYCHAAAYSVRLNYKSIKQTSGIQNLDQSQYLDERAPFPPLNEQKAISSFLDVETSKIDGLVSEQRRLIELLKEKRQAVISHAVTKGLNPGVKLKPSGILWVGDVPEHWEAVRIDRVTDFVNGKAHEPFVDEDGEFICVNSRFVSTDGEAIKMCSQNLTPAIHDDVLMVMSDLPNGRALARTYHVRDNRQYAVNQRVCAIRSTGPMPRFLFYLLNRNPWFLQRDDGLNQTHLPSSAFRKMPLFLPPRDEQERIVAQLDRLSALSSELTTEAERAIELLQERRTALISAAVTGKIDVREYASEEAVA